MVGSFCFHLVMSEKCCYAYVIRLTAAVESRCGATASLPREKKRSKAFQSPAPQKSRSAIRMIIGIDIGKRREKERNTPGYFFRAATGVQECRDDSVHLGISFCPCKLEVINLPTCFLRPSCKADQGLSSTTFHARTANTLPWEESADTPFAQ